MVIKLLQRLKYLLRKLALWFIPETIQWSIRSAALEEVNISYAQEGEDLILSRLIGMKPEGFFVDIGAHDPKRFSNTYRFYQLGWRGINIDPLPGMKSRFDAIRPEDINVEAAIGPKGSAMQYYMFNEPALNTFDGAEARKKATIAPYKIIDTLAIQCLSLEDVFINNDIGLNQPIDFLSIDVEGFEMEVLQQINFHIFRPTVIALEELGTNVFAQERSAAGKYLEQSGYQLSARTVNTSFYVKR